MNYQIFYHYLSNYRILKFLAQRFDTVKIDLKFNTRFIKSPSLINYWPFNSHVQDVIGEAHLFNGSKACLTSDRFDRPISALSLNNGYYQMPSINYFPTGEFTITAWIYIRACNAFSRMFDFFNGPSIESIRLIICNPSNKTRFAYNNGTIQVNNLDTSLLPFNKWNHIALSFGNNNMSIYYNGIFNGSNVASQKLKNLTRLYNFIGRSSAITDPFMNGIIDDLKIFNKALNQKEIQFEMNNQI